MRRDVGVENTNIDCAESLAQVSPHSMDYPIIEKGAKEFVSEDRGKGCGVINESDIGGFTTVEVVILNDREERIDGIMHITARAYPKLIRGHGTMGFCVFGEARNKNTLK